MADPKALRAIFFNASIAWVGCAFVGGWLLTTCNILFNSSNELVYPRPYYQILTTKDTGKAAGLDFSQAYFPTKAWLHGENPYYPASAEYKDKEGRLAGYSPFSLLLYSPLSLLPFKAALAVHLILQIALFVALLYAFLGKAGLRPSFTPALCLVFMLLFFTPIGLTFLERGQFDLYVASAYLLAYYVILFPFPATDRGAGIAAGLLAGIKWTALPLLGALSAMTLVIHKTWVGVWVALAFLFALFILPTYTQQYLDILKYWEGLTPDGIAFDRLFERVGLPVGTGKALFVVLLAAILGNFVLLRRRILDKTDFIKLAIPFSLALGAYSVGIGTKVYEYRFVSALGLLPAALYWFQHCSSEVRKPALILACSFCGFLMMGFRVFPWNYINPGYLIFGYLFFTFLFFALAAMLQARMVAASRNRGGRR